MRDAPSWNLKCIEAFAYKQSLRLVDSLGELLSTNGCGEGLDDGAELVAQKHAVVGGVEADAVIGHTVLGLVVGTDLLGTVTVVDLRVWGT